MKKLSTVSVFSLAFTFAAVLGVATTTTTPAVAADNPDKVYVTTLGVPQNHTDCTNDNFGYDFDQRIPVVRGRHTKFRISRHLVDVGIEKVSVTSCSNECHPVVTKKGNSGGKGFVEIDLGVDSNAPTGNATLVIHYPFGNKGEYKLNIILNSRVDSVERTTDGASNERFIFKGNNLNQFRNSFRANGTGATGFPLSRVSESDAQLVLDRNQKNCSAGQFEVDLPIENVQCSIKNVKINVTRDAACSSGGGGGGGGGVVVAPPSTPTVGGSAKPNLLPSVSTPNVIARALGPEIVTTRGKMVPINNFFCANLEPNVAATVNVPKISWGVSGVNPERATSRFDVQLINGDTNQTIDTQILQQGFPANTPLVQKDNYTGRITTIRAIKDPRFQVGAANETRPGCFTEPAATLPALEPKVLKVKVDPTNLIDEGSKENDNELTF